MNFYRLGVGARRDLLAIAADSERNFGPAAADRYFALLRQAFGDVARDPLRSGSREAANFGTAIRLYHIRFSRLRAAPPIVARPRHLLIYRQLSPSRVGIARILHDSMDLARHAATDFGETQPDIGSS